MFYVFSDLVYNVSAFVFIKNIKLLDRYDKQRIRIVRLYELVKRTKRKKFNDNIIRIKFKLTERRLYNRNYHVCLK